MDIDEDDDFYGTDEKLQPPAEEQQNDATPQTEAKPAKQEDEDLEEGEEEDEEEDDSDSDIDIITERKDGNKPQPPQPARYNEIRNIPQKTAINDASPPKPAAPKKEKEQDAKPSKERVSGVDLPGIKTSKIDVYANPIHEASGKHITEVNMDEDLPDNEKPWRRPGTDVSDYFNYGFDEFTWATYSSKQETNRSEFSADKMAAAQKKMMEDMNMMMMGGMSGMPGMGGAAAGGQMPAMEGMPAEMQAMMQQMMASGMDPSQMDPAAMFAGMQGGAGAVGAAGGAQAGFGQGQNQNMGYGYDQQQGGAGNRGGNFGRGGRGGRRNW